MAIAGVRPMMTEQEVAARVRELMAESRMLEAGFILSMLCRKPADAGADVTGLRDVRAAEDASLDCRPQQ